jgi:hypothetical protein
MPGGYQPANDPVSSWIRHGEGGGQWGCVGSYLPNFVLEFVDVLALVIERLDQVANLV